MKRFVAALAALALVAAVGAGVMWVLNATNGSSASELTEATVVRVVDGDTLVVDIAGTENRVRLIGIDAPESVHPDESRNTEEGKTASEHLTETLTEGTTVWLERDVSDTDRYDRLLRYVWLEKPTNSNSASEAEAKMLNARLVAEGYAEAKDYDPDTKWSELFHSLEDSA